MTKKVDWTKPIRWHGTTEELFHAGELPDGRHVVSDKDEDQSSVDIVRADGSHSWNDVTVFIENIPETIERWVVLRSNNAAYYNGGIYHFDTEAEALEFIGPCDSMYTKPVLVEFQVP